MALIQYFNDFDYSTKYLKISHFNRDSNSIKSKIIPIFLTIHLFLIISRNLVILLIIDDDQHDQLIELADPGYLFSGQSARFMLDLGLITFFINNLVYLIHYQMFDNQWILKINEIYEQIKTQSMDQRLRTKTKKLIRLLKLVTLLINVSLIISISVPHFLNIMPSFYFIYSYIELTIISLIGYNLIVRNIFILIFICQKYIIIFSEINKQIIQSFDSIEINTNVFKSYLNKHYECCESLKIANKYLKNIYVIFVVGYLPTSCYVLYFFFLGTKNTYVNLSVYFILITILLFALFLSLMINMIDFEAKKALHVIHVFALLNKDSQLTFQVCFDQYLN